MKQPFQHVQNICLRLVYCPTIIGHIKADLFIKNVIRLVSSRAKEFPKVVAEAEPVRAPIYTVYLEAAFLSTFILALTSSIIWSPKAIRNWSTPFILPDFLEVFIIKYGFSISIFSLILVFLISPIFNRSGSFEIDIYEITNEEAIRAKEGYQGGGKRRLLYDEPIKQGRFLSKLWSRRGELDIGNKSQYGKIPAAWRIVEDLCELVGKEEEGKEGEGGGGGGAGEGGEEDGNEIINEAHHEGRKRAIEELEELEKRVKEEEEEEEEELKEKERIENENEKERLNSNNNSNSPSLGRVIKRGRQSKSAYGVPEGFDALRSLLMQHCQPPTIHLDQTSKGMEEAKEMVRVGFPELVEEQAGICSCHKALSPRAFLCPQCLTRCCEIPGHMSTVILI